VCELGGVSSTLRGNTYEVRRIIHVILMTLLSIAGSHTAKQQQSHIQSRAQ